MSTPAELDPGGAAWCCLLDALEEPCLLTSTSRANGVATTGKMPQVLLLLLSSGTACKQRRGAK